MNAWSVGRLSCAFVLVVVSSAQAQWLPTGPLAFSTTYTASIKGGGAGVKDVAGNALPAVLLPDERPPLDVSGGELGSVVVV